MRGCTTILPVMAFKQLINAVRPLVRPQNLAVRCFASAAENAAAVDAGASNSSASTPAYTITDAPGIGQQTGKQKWGRYVLRGIKGHTKKLNPLARQVHTTNSSGLQ